MSIGVLLIISAAAAGSVIYLLSYIPLASTFAGRTYSPRLLVCRLVAPFDAAITLVLVAGGWFGISTIITGVSMMIMNILTSIGISIGVVVVRKVMVPRWQRKYETLVAMKRKGT